MFHLRWRESCPKWTCGREGFRLWHTAQERVPLANGFGEMGVGAGFRLIMSDKMKEKIILDKVAVSVL